MVGVQVWAILDLLDAGVRNGGAGKLCSIFIGSVWVVALRCEQGVVGSVHVLWLRGSDTAGAVFCAEVLGRCVGPGAAVVPVRVLAVRVHSSLGKPS